MNAGAVAFFLIFVLPVTFIVLSLIVFVYIQFLFLACAPLAALMCALLAWRRNLNIRQYAFVGALYSLFGFIPCIFLMRWLKNNRELQPKTVHKAYALTHIFWGGLATIHILASWMIVLAGPGGDDLHRPRLLQGEWAAFWGTVTWVWVLWGAAAILSALAYVMFRRAIGHLPSPESHSYAAQSEGMLNRIYLMPFVHTGLLLSIYAAFAAVWAPDIADMILSPFQ